MDLYNASTDLGANEEEEIVLGIEEYEDAKKSLTTIVDRAEATLRLAENDDFKQLVIQGYLTDEPQRLAELMASGRLHKTSMENCADELNAIGKFRSFMKNMVEQGNQARNDLVELEEARDYAIRVEEEAQAQ